MLNAAQVYFEVDFFTDVKSVVLAKVHPFERTLNFQIIGPSPVSTIQRMIYDSKRIFRDSGGQGYFLSGLSRKWLTSRNKTFDAHRDLHVDSTQEIINFLQMILLSQTPRPAASVLRRVPRQEKGGFGFNSLGNS